MKFCFAFLFLFPVFTTLAQAPAERCGSVPYQQQQQILHPEEQQSREAIETFTRNYISECKAGRQSTVQVTIPVVFHVVYKNANEQLSAARLQEQLNTLNSDYRKLNSDASLVPAAWQGIAADCEINFCLALQDPQGAPTTGITYTPTSVQVFSLGNEVKFTSQGGHDIWDPTRYLNIWVCDLPGFTLGYAQFPGGSVVTDGVVLDYAYTGTTGASSPYNLGRSGTHEVAHWLNLIHIWGDDGSSCSGSDSIADTPNHGGLHYGCFNAGQVLTDACSPAAPGIMWMNYMEYVDDACMYMFTNDQKLRMQATLAGPRLSLTTSPGCLVGVPENKLDHGLLVYPVPATDAVTFDYPEAGVITISIRDISGRLVRTLSRGAGAEPLTVHGLPAGMYIAEVRTATETAVRKLVIQ